MPDSNASRTQTEVATTRPCSPSDTPASSVAELIDRANLQLVACPPRAGRVTEHFCIAQFHRANGRTAPDPAGPLRHCYRCPHGAARAGVNMPQGVLSAACLQCGRPSRRLIRDRHCPSCYNRRREVRIGVNARGQAPNKLPPTRVFQLYVAAAQHTPTLRTVAAVTRAEALLVAALDGPVVITAAPVRKRPGAPEIEPPGVQETSVPSEA